MSESRQILCLATLAILAAAFLAALAVAPVTASPDPATDGRTIYEANCAACHGIDGTGADRAQVGFDAPLPDFTECNFVSREPAGDWVGVASEGGPIRGFHHTMPAFGEALSDADLQAAVHYIYGFCGDDGWPRGELNLPRAMYTEKAYPEDEAVWTVISPMEGPRGVSHEIIYEARIGQRSMWELVVPFSMFDGDPAGDPDAADGWSAGFEDVALGFKHVAFHSLRSGSVLSVMGEVILPLGDEADGLSSGTTILEPFLTFGQLLPMDAFLQLQAGAELPWDTDVAPNEAFWRGALGRTFVSGAYGRAWSPMIEVLGARPLVSGAHTEWDIAPQLHVTLNTRQHVQGNVALRIPVTDAGTRDVRLAVFVLWDWFDGGLFEGW